MATNVFSGARAVFYIDGNKVAFAANVDGSEEIQYEPVDVLDNLEVQEHVPVGYRVSFSCGIFRTVRSTPGAVGPKTGIHGSVKEMGFFPKAGQDLLNILTAGVMTAKIIDKSELTGKVLMQLEGVKMSSHNFNVTARGIVSVNCQFVAIRMKDESEVA